MNDVHEIMKYKRPCDIWLCPECDTENSVLLDKCIVCRSQKSLSATVLKQWSEEDDMPKKTLKRVEFIEEYDGHDDYDDYEEEKRNTLIWWIILAAIIIVLFAVAD